MKSITARIVEGYYKSKLAYQLFYNIVFTISFTAITAFFLLVTPAGLVPAWQVGVLMGIGLGIGISCTIAEWYDLFKKLKV